MKTKCLLCDKPAVHVDKVRYTGYCDRHGFACASCGGVYPMETARTLKDVNYCDKCALQAILDYLNVKEVSNK